MAAEARAVQPIHACGIVMVVALLGALSAGAVAASPDHLETTLTETPLSAVEHRLARHWQLTEAEWRRYRLLMEGVRGSLSAPRISPVEVLGIHARDAAERRRYAERWAQLMHEDAGRVLAFQRAYTEAFQRLYGGEPLIDLAGLPGAAPAIDWQPGDRLLFFARTDCGRCDALLPELLATLQAHPGLGLDIYFLDSAEGADDAIQDWARAQALPAAQVGSRTITLNHDNGLLMRLADGATLPTLLHRRGARLTPVAPAALGHAR